MALEKDHQLRLMFRIYQELAKIRDKRFARYNQLMVEKKGQPPRLKPMAEPSRVRDEFTHVQQGFTCVREMDRKIKMYDRMIADLENPRVPVGGMTDQDRFDIVLGTAVDHRLDMSLLVTETQ